MSGGLRGERPERLRQIQACQILHCPPWELEEAPFFWEEWALTYEYGVNWAENEADAHAMAAARARQVN